VFWPRSLWVIKFEPKLANLMNPPNRWLQHRLQLRLRGRRRREARSELGGRSSAGRQTRQGREQNTLARPQSVSLASAPAAAPTSACNTNKRDFGWTCPAVTSALASQLAGLFACKCSRRPARVRSRAPRPQANKLCQLFDSSRFICHTGRRSTLEIQSRWPGNNCYD